MLQEQRRARNEEVELIHCLQFCDKRELLLACNKLQTKLDVVDKRKAEKLLRSAEDLRNRLAHSQDDLVLGSSPEELIGLIQDIEALVHKSDSAVEAYAESVRKDIAMLWVEWT